MMPDESVWKMVEAIYKLYGSSSGYLFGLPPQMRSIVEAIVQATLNCLEGDDA
jgi:hypothetical protein